MKRWQFSYAYWKQATVTVYAYTIEEARLKACAEMDRRYDKKGMEPPVAWTLKLLNFK